MGSPAKRYATYEDLLAVPEPLLAEILDGELVTQPRPGTPHARVGSRLGAELGGPFDRGKGGPGGWILLDEPELHLGSDILVPDLAGWRRERMPRLPMEPALTLAPDWACEILAPRTAARDRTQKPRIYAGEGVTHLWLLDPAARTLEVWALEGGHYMIAGGWREDALVHAAPFETFELELAALWAD